MGIYMSIILVVIIYTWFCPEFSFTSPLTV